MSEKKRIITETEYLFFRGFKVGNKVFSSELTGFFKDKNRQSTGGRISLLLRLGIIKPIFKRGNKKDKNNDICFERVK